MQKLDNHFLKLFIKFNWKSVIINLIVSLSLGFIKTKLLPFAIVSLFGIAFFAVSARIWLPGDMNSPAPINWYSNLKWLKEKTLKMRL